MSSYELSDWLGYLSHREINLLKMLVQSLPPYPLVVNIGAGCGTAAVAFFEARNDLWLVTIDIQKESSPLGCLEGEMTALENSGLPFHGRYRQIHSDSKTAEWAGGSPDMVLIDGDHTYLGCKGDIETWMPRLKRGGILALHDYRKPETDKPHPGVDAAVDELLADRYEMVGHADTLIAFRYEGR